MRINKCLAACGIGSRRQIDAWIAGGRITVNGKKAVCGMTVTASDRIFCDGKHIRIAKTNDEAQSILLYKPVGTVCSRVAHINVPSVFSLLPPPENGRWVMIGRLDINSAGLLLFTTDGALAHAVMHPSYGLVRRYRVRVFVPPAIDMVQSISAGVVVDGEKMQFRSIRLLPSAEGSNMWFEVTLTRGKHREVRRIFAGAGGQVNRLLRIGYGSIQLPHTMRPGAWRMLSFGEMRALYASIDAKETAVSAQHI